jgi:hypothetical protein
MNCFIENNYRGSYEITINKLINDYNKLIKPHFTRIQWLAYQLQIKEFERLIDLKNVVIEPDQNNTLKVKELLNNPIKGKLKNLYSHESSEILDKIKNIKGSGNILNSSIDIIKDILNKALQQAEKIFIERINNIDKIYLNLNGELEQELASKVKSFQYIIQSREDFSNKIEIIKAELIIDWKIEFNKVISKTEQDYTNAKLKIAKKQAQQDLNIMSDDSPNQNNSNNNNQNNRNNSNSNDNQGNSRLKSRSNSKSKSRTISSSLSPSSRFPSENRRSRSRSRSFNNYNNRKSSRSRSNSRISRYKSRSRSNSRQKFNNYRRSRSRSNSSGNRRFNNRRGNYNNNRSRGRGKNYYNNRGRGRGGFNPSSNGSNQ